MSRRPLTVLAAMAVIAATSPLLLAPRASAAAPVLVNSTTVFEHNASSDDAGRELAVTTLVQHDFGQVVTGIAFDLNYDGTDNTATVGATAVTAQQPAGGFNYSRVSTIINPPRPGGFSCGVFSGTRRVTVPVRLRAVTSDTQRTSSVSTNITFAEDDQCLAVTDYAVVESRSQSASAITPGQSVTFTFSGDDADSSGSNDRFARYHWRVRRLNDGVTTQGPSGDVSSCGDNCNNNLTVTFPQRGRFVVEAELGGEDSFENAGNWFRLGSVDVNTAASTSPTVSLSGPSGPVQQGNTATITASAVDTEAFQGRIQMIEWDADGVAGFERREVASTEPAGLPASAFTQTLNTTGLSGTRTITARVTDNGAMNGADTIRRTDTASFVVTINRPPIATDQTVNATEDINQPFTLDASDPDVGDTLAYSVSDPPDHGTLLGSAPNYTYDPDPNFFGTDTFAYSVTDGRGATDTATVTINVAAVNDAPVAQDQAIVTDEDSAFTATLVATDVDNAASSLTFTAGAGPSHGDVVVQAGGGYTYTPDTNYNGTDSFTFQVCDPGSLCDTGQVDVTVTSVNDAPVPQDQEVSTDEDVDLPITLSATDADGDVLIYGIATQPANGTLTGVAPNLTYEPDENFFGSDMFTFSVSDGTVAVTGTVEITVNPVNDAPVAHDLETTTDEDTPLDGQLQATDVDDEDLAFAVGTGPSNGTVIVQPDGTFTYTPNGDFNGDDSFSFAVCDPDNLCDDGGVVVIVVPVNDPPVPDDQDVTTDEDTPVLITLTGSDVDGDALTFAVGTPPANGTLSGAAPVLEYTPGPNFFGSDTFTFTVSDGEATVTGTIDITVNSVNDAPVAQDEALVTNEDTAVTGVLQALDVDHAPDALTFTVGEQPTHGTVAIEPDGGFTYTPAADHHGTDAFTFVVCDPDGACDEEAVDVTILSVNDLPEAQDATEETNEDETLTIELSASDVDGDELSYAFGAPAHGQVVGGGPEVAYTPDPNYHGPDSFTFTVSDGHGGTDTATVQITVLPVNDVPDAIPQVVTTAEDTPIGIDLTAQDIDGDLLQLAVTSPPSHGTLSGTVPNLTYTPDQDFSGNDFFEFTACDTGGLCDTAVVSVTVLELPLIDTALFAEPSVARIQPGLTSSKLGAKVHVPLTLRAQLTRADTGAPLAGETIEFTIGDELVCTAQTDGRGTASCGGIVQVLRSVTTLGYQAYYTGDADLNASAAHGSIVIVGPLEV